MKPKQDLKAWISPGNPAWLAIFDKPHEQILEFLSADIISTLPSNQKAKVFLPALQTQKIVSTEDLFRRTPNPPLIDDLTEIQQLNDGELLNHLAVNFKARRIYCYCKPSLLVVNPYQNIPELGSEECFKKYARGYLENNLGKLSPHVWAVAGEAVYSSIFDGMAQAICVNGESGAGKTVATKMCLDYVARLESFLQFEREKRLERRQRHSVLRRRTVLRDSNLSSHRKSKNSTLNVQKNNQSMNRLSTKKSVLNLDISQKILACNPILEAFGNAKTTRNDNSSRFGKYIKLQLSKNNEIDNLEIQGATITNYLLEKSRAVAIAEGERSFHVFYAMCRFMPEQQLRQLLLLNESESRSDLEDKYSLFGQSIIFESEKLNDNEIYDELQDAFRTLNFSEHEIFSLHKIVAAVLHLSNIRVRSTEHEKSNSGCKIEKNESWRSLIELLELDSDGLEQALTTRKLVISGEVTYKLYSGSAVRKNVLALAKEIYNLAFNWLFIKMNKELSPSQFKSENNQNSNQLHVENISGNQYHTSSTVGILDIFGFEIFDLNSLEQLFINYANERLQSLYVEHTFKSELRLLESEGLAHLKHLITFPDNSPLIASIDYRFKNNLGVFTFLNQSSQLDESDQAFYDGFKRNCTNSEFVFFRRMKRDVFVVAHSARDVEYSVTDFVAKNMDEVSLDLKEVLEQSKNKILIKIFKNQEDSNTQKNKKQVQSQKNSKFLAQKFKSNMDFLMQELTNSHCHFIRCLKPNELKKPFSWVAPLALKQIRYMGLLDSLKVRKNNYPFRSNFIEFYLRFQDLDFSPTANLPRTELLKIQRSWREIVSQMIENLDPQFSQSDILIGNTRVFASQKCYEELEARLKIKQAKKIDSVNKIGKFFKSEINRRAVIDFFGTESRGISAAREMLKHITAKVTYSRFKKKMRLVRKMQNNFRVTKYYRVQAQKRYNVKFLMKIFSLHKLKNQLQTTILIQRSVRFFQDRYRFVLHMRRLRFCRRIVYHILQRTSEAISHKEKKISILHIQSTIRSWLLRIRLGRQYNSFADKVHRFKYLKSCLLLQSHYRGYKVRKRFQELITASRTIQSWIRTKWMREYFLQLRSAVIMVQRAFRKYRVRKRRGREMWERMESRFDVPGGFQAIENGVLYGLGKDLVLEIVDSARKGRRQDYFNLLERRALWLQGNRETEALRSLSRKVNKAKRQHDYSRSRSKSKGITRDIGGFDKSIRQANNYIKHLKWGGTGNTKRFKADQVERSKDWKRTSKLEVESLKNSMLEEKIISQEKREEIKRKLARNTTIDLNHVPTQRSIPPELQNLLQSTQFPSSPYLSIPTAINHKQLNPKASLFFLPVDILTNSDPTIFYPYSLSRSILDVNLQLQKIGDRILHIKLGNTFCLIHSWLGRVITFGANDFNQLARSNKNHFLEGPRIVENLSRNRPKFLELGGEHGVMIDQNDNIITWGANSRGQLGLCHNNDNGRINVLNGLMSINDQYYDIIDDSVTSISAKGAETYVITGERSLFIWGKQSNTQKKSDNRKLSRSLLIKDLDPELIIKNSKINEDDNIIRKRKSTFLPEKLTRGKLLDQLESPENRDYTHSFGKNNNSNRVNKFEIIDHEHQIKTNNNQIKNENYGSYHKLESSFPTMNSDISDLKRNPFKPKVYNFPSKIQAQIVCSGLNFALILCLNGQIYAHGSNSKGQCGFPLHEQYLQKPTPIPYFIQKGSFLIEIACGREHSIVLSRSGKALLFGSNRYCQMGHAKTRTQPKPRILKWGTAASNHRKPALITSVAASAEGVAILTERHELVLLGQWGAGVCKNPKVLDYQKTFFQSKMKESFVPGRISCSWSSFGSVLGLTFMDFRGLSRSIQNFQSKICSNYFNKWRQSSGGALVANFDKNLSQYISNRAFTRPGFSKRKGKLEYTDNVLWSKQNVKNEYKQWGTDCRKNKNRFQDDDKLIVNYTLPAKSRTPSRNKNFNKDQRNLSRSPYQNHRNHSPINNIQPKNRFTSRSKSRGRRNVSPLRKRKRSNSPISSSKRSRSPNVGNRSIVRMNNIIFNNHMRLAETQNRYVRPNQLTKASLDSNHSNESPFSKPWGPDLNLKKKTKIQETTLDATPEILNQQSQSSKKEIDFLYEILGVKSKRNKIKKHLQNNRNESQRNLDQEEDRQDNIFRQDHDNSKRASNSAQNACQSQNLEKGMQDYKNYNYMEKSPSRKFKGNREKQLEKSMSDLKKSFNKIVNQRIQQEVSDFVNENQEISNEFKNRYSKNLDVYAEKKLITSEQQGFDNRKKDCNQLSSKWVKITSKFDPLDENKNNQSEKRFNDAANLRNSKTRSQQVQNIGSRRINNTRQDKNINMPKSQQMISRISYNEKNRSSNRDINRHSQQDFYQPNNNEHQKEYRRNQRRQSHFEFDRSDRNLLNIAESNKIYNQSKLNLKNRKSEHELSNQRQNNYNFDQFKNGSYYKEKYLEKVKNSEHKYNNQRLNPNNSQNFQRQYTSDFNPNKKKLLSQISPISPIYEDPENQKKNTKERSSIPKFDPTQHSVNKSQRNNLQAGYPEMMKYGRRQSSNSRSLSKGPSKNLKRTDKKHLKTSYKDMNQRTNQKKSNLKQKSSGNNLRNKWEKMNNSKQTQNIVKSLQKPQVHYIESQSDNNASYNSIKYKEGFKSQKNYLHPSKKSSNSKSKAIKPILKSKKSENHVILANKIGSYIDETGVIAEIEDFNPNEIDIYSKSNMESFQFSKPFESEQVNEKPFVLEPDSIPFHPEKQSNLNPINTNQNFNRNDSSKKRFFQRFTRLNDSSGHRKSLNDERQKQNIDERDMILDGNRARKSRFSDEEIYVEEELIHQSTRSNKDKNCFTDSQKFRIENKIGNKRPKDLIVSRQKVAYQNITNSLQKLSSERLSQNSMRQSIQKQKQIFESGPILPAQTVTEVETILARDPTQWTTVERNIVKRYFELTRNVLS